MDYRGALKTKRALQRKKKNYGAEGSEHEYIQLKTQFKQLPTIAELPFTYVYQKIKPRLH